jgi:hypothetical protein
VLFRSDSTAALRPTFGGAFQRGEPLPIIWIFTCNGVGSEQVKAPHSLLPRFVSRCWEIPFVAAPRAQLSEYLETIWRREGGPATPEGYFDYIAEGVGVRDALMRLDVDLLAGPRPRPAPEPSAPIPQRASVVSIRHDVPPDVFAARSAAAHKAWATRWARQR